MANEVEIILKAVDKASAELKKVTDSAGFLGKAADKLGVSTGALVGGFAAVAGGAVAVGRELGKIVNDTVAYGKSVDDLSRALGISAEESSKLIQIADDLRIDVGTLKMGFKKALTEGVAPNIEGIKDLAKQYQALPSPVDKAQFSMKYFGRAGLELNKILELTPDEIDAMAASAQAAGLVLSGSAVQATKDYYLALDQMSDSVEGAKTQIGIGLIPVLTDVADEVNRVMTEFNAANTATTLLEQAVAAGVITNEEAVTVLQDMNEAGGDMTEVNKIALTTEALLRDDRRESIDALEDSKTATDNLGDAVETETGMTEAAMAATKMYSDAVAANSLAADVSTGSHLSLSDQLGALQLLIDGPVGQAYDDYIQRTDDLTAEAEALRAKIVELEAREYLTEEQKAELDGLYTDLEEVTTAITENADAHDEATARILFNILQQQLAIDGYTADELLLLTDVGNAWGLIDDKTLEATEGMAAALKAYSESGDLKQFLADLDTIKAKADAIPTDITIDVKVNYEDPGNPLKKKPKQFGGPVWGGESYLVGEHGPELFVPSSAGNIVNNWNLTVNEAGNRGNVVQDFELMKALARA